MTKIDSNVVTLRWCEEDSFKTVSGDETWYILEPNEFTDHGAAFTQVARRPFRTDRQARKGSTTSVTASGGFGLDMVQEGLQQFLQGFFYANLRRKSETTNDAGTEITSVADTNNRIAGPSLDTTYPLGTLIQLTGFGVSANNVHLAEVTAVAAGTIDVDADLQDEASPTQTSGGVPGARIVEVGFEFTAGDLDVDVTGNFATYTTTTKDLTDFGLLPGEWIYVGGDAAANAFSNAVNNGWKRVRSVSANALVVDKSDNDMVTEASTTETIRIFFGRVLKNESDSSLITRTRTYQLERELGAPDAGSPTELQADYITGATPNTFEWVWPAEELLRGTAGFVGGGYERVSAAAAPNIKSAVAAAGSGAAPGLTEEDPFNTSVDFSRSRLYVIDSADEAPEQLFTNIETSTLAIDNGVTENKAQQVQGSCGNSLGLFTVNVSLTGYFEDMDALNAVANNSDVTYDVIMAKGAAGAKSGVAWDVPLLTMGADNLELALDSKIKLPMTGDAASGAKVDTGLDHTLMMCFFDALPDAAAA